MKSQTMHNTGHIRKISTLKPRENLWGPGTFQEPPSKPPTFLRAFGTGKLSQLETEKFFFWDSF